MLRIPRRARRCLVPATVLLLVALAVAWAALPPDSPVGLAVRFNVGRLTGWARGTAGDATLLRRPGRHRVDLASDVGFLIKTGYGTRHRLPEQLDALSRHGTLGPEGRGFLVVGDWTAANATDARRLGVEVHNVVGMVMDTRIDAGSRGHQRFDKYRRLQAAVAAGDEHRALVLGQTYGWELDALKFIMGMELAYWRLPRKKWYMILDDDTYLVKASLERLLSHLDPGKSQYVGKAVGDYRARFAHGGSGVLVSGPAMRALFGRPDVVTQAYAASLDETWGDRLVATTLQKVGVYLSERHSHHFSGEPPELARIGRDGFCAPVVSFHGLRSRGAMARVGARLAGVGGPVLRGQLWALFGDQPMERHGRGPFAAGDHVGPRREGATSWRGVGDGDGCRARCERQGARCLAWTYRRDTGECRGSPWVVVGEGGGGGGASVSGLNWKRMEPWARGC